MTSTLEHPPGSLVRARGRDWVVLPQDEDGVVRLRPIDGADEDATGLFMPLEPDAVHSSLYPAPTPEQAGEFTGALLLRDAVRLGLRSGAGPFRSMGRLSVTPRPYQFVPLIMALRLDPIRLLIADDVGVGKTIEAAMIARELLDRGIVRRLAVVCPPHLCEQWARELREKFNIDPAVIQPARMARLKRELPRADVNVFQHYRHIVASIDFVKSDRYRQVFLDNAPDLIIVDEAHAAARPRGDRARGQHQRYELIKELAASPQRHLILVTATPHSGIEESYRSLLGLLDEEFDLPEERRLPRARLARHFVQRRRADLQRWLGVDTPFPERESSEHSYQMSSEYLRLFENVLGYCRESVSAGAGMRQQQRRVRYWAAIAILRCLLSSPAAAEVMLEKRAERRERSAPAEDTDVDEVFAAQVLDSIDEEEPSDYVPTAPLDDPEAEFTGNELRRLDGFLRTARGLSGPEHDAKLRELASVVAELLRDGFSPIVYCRYIATAKYVGEQLGAMLRREHASARVVSVSGGDGDSEQREKMVKALAKEPVRVLIATECLSEGINLQDHFDAVVHYDLPWNPNRLEQREGRVDRYGQPRSTVKTVLLYGSDNPVDLVVLDVLIRKARTIRRQLGISVPVPVESDEVVQAVIDSVLLRGQGAGQQLRLALEEPRVSAFHDEWDRAADRESTARAYFAQAGIEPDEVARELEELEPVLGGPADVHRFVANALQRLNGRLAATDEAGVLALDPATSESRCL